MKKNIFFKGLASLMIGALAVSGLSSCGHDYLDLKPITSTSAADIAGSIEGARAAKTGLCQGMYRQMSSNAINKDNNGEAAMSKFYGEVFGGNCLYDLYCGHSTSDTYISWNQVNRAKGWGPSLMWSYAYNLINWANMIIENIDNLDPFDGERDFIKAVALTIRAHAYTRLLQVYAPNWENADNGNVYCIVLRESSSVEEKNFSTMNEVLNLIYSDLDSAIALFESCNWERDFIWEPDIHVAKGIYSRVAMLKHDYVLAEKMAKEAREGYPIMSAAQYLSGFVTANDEYMWASYYEAPATAIYYYADGNWWGCNGRYQASWGYTVAAIDYDFYRRFPITDIRKKLYLTPEFLTLNKALADKHGVKAADFWDPDKVFTNGFRIQLNNKNSKLQKMVIEYGKQEFERLKPINNFLSGTVAPYQSSKTEVLFGIQWKFWGNQIYGMNQPCFMRASEMAYNEAEAAFRNGNEARAREILIELNKDKRDPNFTCTESGDALLQKIMDYRGFELWGEGFNWFDLKRWHVGMKRIGWKANDPSSGNRGEGFCQTFGPDDFYGWRFIVPEGEFNYNKLADPNILPGGNK